MEIKTNRVNTLNVVLKLTLAIKVAAHDSMALTIGHGLSVTMWNG